MSKLQTGILGFTSSFLWACSGFVALSEDAPDDIWAYCRADDSCTIEYDHLSAQSDEPFMFLGYVMDSEQARWGQFRKAIRAFPDVQSCLIEEEQVKENPNLLEFDWETVGTGAGAEVCVFRITRSLGDLSRVKTWLKFHGFNVGKYGRYRSEKVPVRRDNQPVASMTGYWTTDQYRENNSSFLKSLIGFGTVLRYEVTISFSESGQVVGVSVLTPSK